MSLCEKIVTSKRWTSHGGLKTEAKVQGPSKKKNTLKPNSTKVYEETNPIDIRMVTFFLLFLNLSNVHFLNDGLI